MKKILLLLPTLLSTALMAENVSNVRAMQQDEKVVVIYDLLQNSTTSLFVSFDGGEHFRTANTVSGEIGKSQLAGNNKVIYWNAVQDAGYFDCPNIVFKVVAVNDGTSLPNANSVKRDPSDGVLPADVLHINKERPNHYTLNGAAIPRQQVARMAVNDMRINQQSAAYADYKKAQNTVGAGWSFFALGPVLSIGIGMPLMICCYDEFGYSYEYDGYGNRKNLGMLYGGATIAALGGALFIASIPMLAVGYKHKYRAVDQYLFGKQTYSYTHNMPNSPSQPAIELRPSYNGLGLAITF